MSRRTSRIRMVAEAVLVGLPCIVIFRLWVMVMAEALKREPKTEA